MSDAQSQVFPIFPSPVTLVPGALAPDLAQRLAETALAARRATNSKDDLLSHTQVVDAASDPDYRRVADAVAPHVAAFGALILGEELTWSVKEIWTNVLETGGAQALHNHANSFVSGVIYLTPNPKGAGTVFHKGLGGSDFSFVNQHERVRLGPFSASRWQIPEVDPGDLILFPSYILHEVPPNRGERRLTIAFNALPDRIESFGYAVHFR